MNVKKVFARQLSTIRQRSDSGERVQEGGEPGLAQALPKNEWQAAPFASAEARERIGWSEN
ncbi:hypothetical protein [Xanthomonas sacchari]|uniref:hypothetical protein n=1 Tax=Xanthomonas sacchari TaxID=56458 RepID=UPI002257D52C|nr:hypothetical protein [Xanthomonas sacchari]